MFAQFKTRAEGVSAEVHRFATNAEALACILGVLRDEDVADAQQKYAVWAACPFLEALIGSSWLNAPV